VQTRWHQDDLSGWLLEQETEEPDRWHIVNFEAIKEEEPLKIPASCTLEPDDRKPGEALCSERYNLKWLKKKAKKIGTYFWGALYQQRPSPVSGALWKRHWFEGNTFTEAPAGLRNVGYDWDTAYTKDERNSATAYVRSGKDAEGNIYILDAGYRFLETPAAEQWMIELKGPHFIEQKASGKSLAQGLRRRGIAAVEVPIRGGGDKYARTTQVTPYAESGQVRVAAHLLDKLLNDEKQGILRFPNASHDDLNDALVQALNRQYPLNLVVRRHHRGGR
jgi:predicted phage terminase large subunit-like protein